jgi:hypothetical protein
MEVNILEKMFLIDSENKKENEDLELIDYEEIEQAISQMRVNLWERHAERMIEKVERRVDELLSKTWTTIKEMPVTCNSTELMMAAWVLTLKEKNKKPTIISLNRWFKANAHRTKEDLEDYIFGKVDIHSILEGYCNV